MSETQRQESEVEEYYRSAVQCPSLSRDATMMFKPVDSTTLVQMDQVRFQ